MLAVQSELEVRPTAKRKAGADRQPVALSEGGPLHIPVHAPVTLTDALIKTAATYPDRGIRFVSADGEESFQTYPLLLDNARRVASGLRNAGVKARENVILQIDAIESHFTAFWSCVLSGAIPVAVAPAASYKEKEGVVSKLFNTWKLLDRPAILTNRHLADAIVGLQESMGMEGIRVLCIEDLITAEPLAETYPARPSEPFFYQLTSGSTGVPKCIQETHKSVIAHIHLSQQFNCYTSNDVSLNWLPFDHVVPILTFHLKDTYLGCQQIHVKPACVLSDPTRWLDLMEKYQVTHTWSPNFGFKLVSDHLARTPGRPRNLSSLKFLMNAGEQVTRPVVEEFLRHVSPFGVKSRAMQPAFGMAEVCTCMTYNNDFAVEASTRRFLKDSLDRKLEESKDSDASCVEFVDLGGPAPGVSIRIVNDRNEILPEAVIGRFQIKGDVVTPGYLHNPEANKEAFVGDDWFNTGDIGFILDGHLFLTGRQKEIIVIRGAKFYCYEIEDVVNGVEGVESTFAAASSVADPSTGTEQLAIFFVPKQGATARDVCRKIKQKITAGFGITPGHVIPMEKARFPKTTSGKIQRLHLKKALEKGEFAEAERQLVATGPSVESRPLSDVESRLAKIWGTVLNVSTIEGDACLFELGGDSLKAVQIATRVRESFGVELPMATIFESASTLAGMAQWIEKSQQVGGQRPVPALEPVPRTQPLPLSYGQQQLWILDQLQPGTSLYNVARALELDGPLDVAALENALHEIFKRHEILRTNFVSNARPSQRVNADLKLALPVRDLTHSAESEGTAAAWKEISDEASKPFDLKNETLVRAKLYQLQKEKYLLALTFHQTVIDGTSVDLFFNELKSHYEALSRGGQAPLQPLRIQYGDYAAWQRQRVENSEFANQSVHWKQKLAGSLPVINLSTEAKPSNSIQAAVETLVLRKELVDAVRSFNQREGVTMFMTLLAVYKVLLSEITGQKEIIVGSPKNGRNHSDLESLIGFFVNTLVLRTAIDGKMSFRELVRQVRSTAVEAYSNSDVPFERLVQELKPARSMGQPPFFQVWFGAIDSLQPFEIGRVQARPSFVPPGSAQFDLAVFVAQQKETVSCLFEYKRDVLSSERVRKLILRFEQLLTEAVCRPEEPIASMR